jgi:hypothetical protein
MRRYRRGAGFGLDDICAFMAAVDRHLSTSVSVVIIGGAAAAFHHAESTTNDVDTYDAFNAALEAAIQRDTGLDIPVNHSTVADVPGITKIDSNASYPHCPDRRQAVGDDQDRIGRIGFERRGREMVAIDQEHGAGLALVRQPHRSSANRRAPSPPVTMCQVSWKWLVLKRTRSGGRSVTTRSARPWIVKRRRCILGAAANVIRMRRPRR